MNPKNSSFLRNSLSAYVPFLFDFCLKILIIRIILLRLGPEALGTWGLLKAAILFPLFLQQGFSFAVFVQTSRERQWAARSSEALSLSIVFGAVVALILIFLAPNLVSLFRIPDKYFFMAVAAFRISGITFLSTCVSGVFLQTLQGMGRFDLASVIQSSSSLLNSFLAISLLHAGYQILSLMIVDLGTSLLSVVVGFVVICKVAGTTQFAISLSTRGILMLLKEAANQLSVAAFARLLWEIDAFLITRYFGVTSMASYWLGQRLTLGWRSFLWAGAWPAVPATAQKSADPKNHLEKIHLLQVTIAIPAAAFIWLYAGSIIRIWTGGENLQAQFVLRVLIVASLFDFLPAAFVSYLFAHGFTSLVARSLMAAALMKVLLSVIACLTANFPLLLLSTLTGALLFSILIHAVTRKESEQTTWKLLKPILPATLSSFVCVLTFISFSAPQSLVALLASALTFGLIAYSLSWLGVRLIFPETHAEIWKRVTTRFGFATK